MTPIVLTEVSLNNTNPALTHTRIGHYFVNLAYGDFAARYKWAQCDTGGAVRSVASSTY